MINLVQPLKVFHENCSTNKKWIKIIVQAFKIKVIYCSTLIVPQSGELINHH